MNTASIETSIDHFSSAFGSFLKGIIHFVKATAPIAEIVGTAIGNPEVVAGAKIAEVVAAGAEAATTAGDGAGANEPK